MTSPMLRLRGITRAFRGLLANDGVNLDIRGGEVHAIVVGQPR